jgi:hypothetical protein
MAEQHRIQCGGCADTWTALGAAHCGLCHQTFSGVALFDLHRSQYGERGACQHPNDVRHKQTGQQLMFFRDGMWRGPEMTEEQKLARFGAA